MKAKDLKDIFHKELDQIYGKDEVASFFYLGIEHHLNVARIQLQLEPEFTLSKTEADFLFETFSSTGPERDPIRSQSLRACRRDPAKVWLSSTFGVAL